MIIKAIIYCFNLYKTKSSKPTITNFLTVRGFGILPKIHISLSDTYSLKERYFVSNDNLINLSGGIPTHEFINCWIQGNSVSADIYKVNIDFDFGVDKKGNPIAGIIKRTLDFRSRIILNDEIQLQKKGSHIGTNIVLNQVNEARKLGFYAMIMHAAGGVDYPPGSGWEGYKVWAKYGKPSANPGCQSGFFQFWGSSSWILLVV